MNDRQIVGAAMLAPAMREPEPAPARLTLVATSSLPERIADAIVEGIATDVIEPGARLVELDICARLDVSRIPVREAFKILEAQGVAVSLPRRGYRVATFDDARAAQVREVRLSLELIAARDASRRLARQPELSAGLERIVGDMALRVERNDWSGPNGIDIAFHREMCRVSGNDIVLTLWEAIARHIRIIFGRSVDTNADPAFLFDEHRRLCDLLLTGDEDAIADEMRRHLRLTHLRGSGGVAKPPQRETGTHGSLSEE